MKNILYLCKGNISLILLVLFSAGLVIAYYRFGADMQELGYAFAGLLIIGAEFVFWAILSYRAGEFNTLNNLYKTHLYTVIVMTLCIMVSDCLRTEPLGMFGVLFALRTSTSIFSVLIGKIAWAVYCQRLFFTKEGSENTES